MAKLLLITHDECLATAYQVRLTRAGFDVERAPSGFSGLSKARQWGPELILLDVSLPGLHGLDVLKWLRDVPQLVTVPVVLLIERTLDPDILHECMLWGANSVLQKDFSSLDAVVAHLQTVRRHTSQPTPIEPRQ